MKLIFTCFLLIVVLFTSAQQNTFKVSAFAPESGSLNQMIQLSDGSFVGVGELFYNNYIDTGYLIKTDAGGSVLAYKRIPTTAGITTITKTNDGGFAICGNLGKSTQLIKFNADLTIQWEKDYSNDGTTAINKMIQATDNSFLLVGSYFNRSEGELSAYIIKTSSDGSLQFAKRFHNTTAKTLEDIYFNGIVATTDGNYALLAEVVDYSITTNFTTYLIKINPTADTLWCSSVFGSTAQQGINSYNITTSSDGGLLISGYLSANFGNSSYNYAAAIIKYNNAGTLLWSKYLAVNNSGGNSNCNGMLEDKDNGYLFYGAIDKSINNDTAYTYIAKTNASGTLQWVKKFYPVNTGTFYTEILNLIQTSDGGYAACGEGAFYYSQIRNYSKSGFIFKFNESFGICTDSVSNEGTLQNIGASAPIVINIGDVATTVTNNVSVYLTNANTTQIICSSQALPLQLLSFKATLQNKIVAIQWTTANEVNTSYFEVERSKDAASFTALQKVIAKGNNVSTQFYNLTDIQPLPGTSYYRLKEMDKDGSVIYSSVVSVTLMNNGAVIISPNPVKNVVRVVVQTETNSHIVCQLIDMKGNLLATQNTSLAVGRNEINIPVSALAKGVYLLKTIQNHSVQTLQFVKQ